MSSEQRYDYFHKHFLRDSLNLFDESTGTSSTNLSSYELREDEMANLPQGGQSFFNDAYISDQNPQFETPGDIPDDFEFDTLGALQHYASTTDGFALLDFATADTGAEHPGFSAGGLSDHNDAFQTLANTAGHPQYDFSEFWSSPPDSWAPDGIFATALAMPLDVPFTRPIDNDEKNECTTREADWSTTTDSAQRSDLMAALDSSTVVPTATSAPTHIPDVDIDIEWFGPQKCHWQACASKATFRSPSSLKAHIRNVHVSPLICTHPGCSYMKPFGKQCDLKRHIATIHGTKHIYRCLESECKETFSRKDKMMKHARENHELFRCSCNHCLAIVCATQRQSHLKEAHGLFECAIGSCKSGGRSYFHKKDLRGHLKRIHGVRDYWVDMELRGFPNDTKKDEVLYFRGEQIPALSRDCASCLSSEA